MGDHFPARITIGGPLKSTTLTDFIHCCKVQGVQVGDYDGDYDDHQIEEAINCAIAEGKPVEFFDRQASGGEFSSLEPFCIKHGLTYLRHNDTYESFDSQYKWWKPGMTEPGYCHSDFNGNQFIDMKLLRSIFDDQMPNKRGRIEMALNRHTPPVVPPLVLIK